jgi:DNA-binding transcriptional ArsR family regulator
MEHSDAVRALAALAQEHRLAIYRLLVTQGASGLPAGEIARGVGIGLTSLSFHMKELMRRAGALMPRRYVRYAIHIEGMRQLIAFLTEECCQGHPELCGSGMKPALRKTREKSQ